MWRTRTSQVICYFIGKETQDPKENLMRKLESNLVFYLMNLKNVHKRQSKRVRLTDVMFPLAHGDSVRTCVNLLRLLVLLPVPYPPQEIPEMGRPGVLRTHRGGIFSSCVCNRPLWVPGWLWVLWTAGVSQLWRCLCPPLCCRWLISILGCSLKRP